MEMRIVVPDAASVSTLSERNAGVASVEMWLGERSYTLARWVPVETWQ